MNTDTDRAANPVWQLCKRDPFWIERERHCFKKLDGEFLVALVIRDCSPCVTIVLQPNDIVLHETRGKRRFGLKRRLSPQSATNYSKP